MQNIHINPTICRISLKPLNKKRKFEHYNDNSVKNLFGSIRVSPYVQFNRNQLDVFPSQHQGKMSISGFQPKMHAKIDNASLVQCQQGGQYIIKPSPSQFPNLAENEHAIMTLAKLCGFDVPAHGLIELSNHELAFIIKRYDRISHDKNTDQSLDLNSGKLQQEQLDGAMNCNDKFGKHLDKAIISYARAGQFINQHLKTVSAISDYFLRVVFSYVVGNNDHHLRNFSIIYDPISHKPSLAPVYDVVSVVPYPQYFHNAWLALPLLLEEEERPDADQLAGGFERQFGKYDRNDFLQLGTQIGLSPKAARVQLDKLLMQINKHYHYVEHCHMPSPAREQVIQNIKHCLHILS